jgi:16S rRNA (uracil1498-N3)-methyltransferase
MSFFYDKNTGEPTLKIESSLFEHIYKIRRTKKDELLDFRNLCDDNLYTYKTQYIEKRSATLQLVTSASEQKIGSQLHIGWCVVDPKTVEKALPLLNELGVGQIDFIYSKRSQRNFNIKPERFESIIVNSCQQSGRSKMMSFEIYNTIAEWAKSVDSFCVLDFGGEPLPKEAPKEIYLVGPEGGFSEDEREFLAKEAKKIYSLGTSLVLKSETAAITVASRFV